MRKYPNNTMVSHVLYSVPVTIECSPCLYFYNHNYLVGRCCVFQFDVPQDNLFAGMARVFSFLFFVFFFFLETQARSYLSTRQKCAIKIHLIVVTKNGISSLKKQNRGIHQGALTEKRKHSGVPTRSKLSRELTHSGKTYDPHKTST